MRVVNNLRSQFGTSSWGSSRYLPMAFTEQGVEELKKQTDERFEVVFSVLDKLLAEDDRPKKKIGL